ncbi:MAG: imm11 family protein [Burkholderiales bacterium]
MHYALEYDYLQDDRGGYLEIHDGLEFEGLDSWSLGRLWPNAVVPKPIVVDLVPIEGYTGAPNDMYDENMCLMSDRMVAVLQSAGVDNLDLYPASLRNAETGESYPFQAVNIIGAVRAADLKQSVWHSHDGDALFDTEFDSLVVNENGVRDLLMFRMAENTGVILIAEKIKRVLEASKFPTLRFIDPKNLVA